MIDAKDIGASISKVVASTIGPILKRQEERIRAVEEALIAMQGAERVVDIERDEKGNPIRARVSKMVAKASPIFEEGRAYAKGSTVVFEGKSWIAAADATVPPGTECTPSQWTRIP